MALNKEVFRTRALSSLVFVLVMLAGLLWNRWSFLLLFSIIHFGCWREYIRLIGKIYNVSFHRYVHYGFALIGFGFMLIFCDGSYAIGKYGLKDNLCMPVSLAGFIMLWLGIFQKSNIFNLKSFAAAALGWVYISLSWGMLVSLSQISLVHETEHLHYSEKIVYRLIPIMLIIMIWGNDTFAYLVGSFIGKTPFSKISPKKTWEGTLGGVIIAVGGAALLMSFFVFAKPDTFDALITWHFWAIIALIGAVIGTAGDLLESKLKRLANVKDSGAMLPGHGGFMDRFDSLLLATPFVWVFVKVFTWL